ncbi:MAG: serine hydrolase domain-containing protein [bacterium]|nr:serine hydrolase domain-containing protein [bacterium]
MIEPVIEKLMSEQHIPGLAVGIMQGDALVHEGYYGRANLEHDVPVTAESVFEIASVTKLFTAQALLRLIQEGNAALYDRLSDYLDDLPEAWKAITIRHCLTHQSGIPSYTSIDRYWTLTRYDKTPAEVLDLVRELPLTFTPGTRYSYDNTGYYLLGLLIERLSGKSFGDMVDKLIFAPLNMRQTTANGYARIIPHRAQGYLYRDGDFQNKPFYDISNTFSAGVLLSTVRDLLAWRASWFNDTVLNAEFRRLWWTPHPSQTANERSQNFSLGLGWFLLDDPRGQFYGHNGGIAGFASSLLYMPQPQLTAVVLCNAGDIDAPHEIAFTMMQALDLL